jgi:tetratricopeptide (TPR) repeat protein
VRVAPAALLALLLLPSPASPQAYPDLHPVPRSTNPATLRGAALDREVRERFRIGFDAEGRGDWGAARAEFDRIVELRPAEPLGSSARYDRALALFNLHDYPAAATDLNAALTLDPDFLAARANLVAVDLARDNLTAARKDAAEFVQRAPDSARARYVSGLAALRAGDAAAAAREFGVLLLHNPAYAVAHYDLALAEVDLARFDDAERELRTALRLAPDYARARFALGTVLARSGKRDEARAAFDETARTSHDPALVNLANSMRDALSH